MRRRAESQHSAGTEKIAIRIHRQLNKRTIENPTAISDQE